MFFFRNLITSTVSSETPNVSIERQAYESSSNLVSIGAPKFSGGASFETMDFSLPSYDEGVGNTDAAPKKSAPSFSPDFPELKLPSSSEEKSAEDVEAAKQAAEEEKAAAKKQAEEEKAAAKKQAEEEKAAAKKAAEEEKVAKAAREKAAEEEKAAKEKV